MPLASPPNAPVLIVGAGPTGLTMALDLTMRGIKCRIIDRLPIPSDKSKALAMHARTLEMFDERGVVENFLNHGHKVHGTNICSKEHVLVHLSFEEIGGPYPFTLVIPQNITEKVLNEELEKRGVFVERGVELATFAQDLEKVTALLSHPDGRKEEFETPWIIGCDGAHSTIRHTLNLKFDGALYDEAFATIDCDVEWSKSNEELYGFLADDGVAFFFPVAGKRFRVVADDAMPKDDDVLTLEHVQKIVDHRCGPGIVLSNATWLTWFKINRRGVTSYRENRAFVCGDSAHVHSPALGQGMNTGIQDAMNLAWKLDLVIKGLADPDLLDTYQTERYPIGRDVLKNTDAVTKLVTFRNPVVQELRNHLMPILAEQEVVQHRACQTLSMLAINYRHSPLVGKYRSAQAFSLNHPLESASAWLDFGHGPAPGDRARDGKLTAASTSKEIRLFEIFQNLKHNILVFAGLHNAPEDLEAISETLRVLTEKSRGVIATHLVLPDLSEVARFQHESILCDRDGALHHTYGAAQSCLYVVRPDGYVGFASQPIDVEQLGTWLAKTFNHNQVLEPAK